MARPKAGMLELWAWRMKGTIRTNPSSNLTPPKAFVQSAEPSTPDSKLVIIPMLWFSGVSAFC